MICVGTRVAIVDNSGAKEALCIRVLGAKNVAEMGDVIIVSIKKLKRKGKVKKKDIFKAMVLRTCLVYRRKDGCTVKFGDNSIVLLNNKLQPIGNRVKGPMIYELRKHNIGRLLSISTLVF